MGMTTLRSDLERLAKATKGKWTDVKMCVKNGRVYLYALRELCREGDDEPITEEWLRSVGFKPRGDTLDGERPIYIRGCVMLASDGTFVHLRFNDRYMSIQNKETRGQLRHLCSALGITLPQPPESL